MLKLYPEEDKRNIRGTFQKLEGDSHIIRFVCNPKNTHESMAVVTRL